MKNSQELEEMKSKAITAGSILLQKSLLIKDAAQEKMRILTQKAKLRAAIAERRSTIKELYSELGSMYYLINKDSPDDMMKQTCDEITLLLQKIESDQECLKELEVAQSPLNEEPEEEISVEIYEMKAENSEEKTDVPQQFPAENTAGETEV